MAKAKAKAKKKIMLYSNSVRGPVNNWGQSAVVAYEPEPAATFPPQQQPPIPPPPPPPTIDQGELTGEDIVPSPFLIGCLDDIVVQTRSARQDTRKLWDAINRLRHELRHL